MPGAHSDVCWYVRCLAVGGAGYDGASSPAWTASLTFAQVMEHVAQAFEALGVAVLASGAVWSFFLAGRTWRRSRRPRQAYALLRQAFGGTLLLGLEILVAADLVRTIAVAPSLSNVLNLGLVVLIRTFLSFSLETEINGMPPWRRGLMSGGDAIAQASRRPQDQPLPQVAEPGEPYLASCALISGRHFGGLG